MITIINCSYRKTHNCTVRGTRILFSTSLYLSILSAVNNLSFSSTQLYSLGEGDQDLYVSFDGEPGHGHYDYHSSLSSSSVDEITIDASSSHYCLGCYVYVAVYGFTHGHFTITCTSKGITNLQAGRAITGILYLFFCKCHTTQVYIHSNKLFSLLYFIPYHTIPYHTIPCNVVIIRSCGARLIQILQVQKQ